MRARANCSRTASVQKAEGGGVGGGRGGDGEAGNDMAGGGDDSTASVDVTRSSTPTIGETTHSRQSRS